MAMYSQGTSPLPVQPTPHAFPHHLYPSHQPHASTANNAFLGTYSSNSQSSRLIPNTPPTFLVAPWSINQPNGSKGKPNRHKPGKDNAWWRLISLLQFIHCLHNHHSTNGTMTMLITITMLRIRATQRRIVPYSNIRYKNWLRLGS